MTMKISTESYTYAREAERAVSQLADVITPDAGKADYDNRTLALGLSGIINALLSIDDAVRSAADDVTEALADVGGTVAGAIDAAHEILPPLVPRRRWWKGAAPQDRRAYHDARVALAALSTDVGEAEFDAANDAVIITAARLPWWQR